MVIKFSALHSPVLLYDNYNFREDRIRNGIKKLTKARQGSTQGRLDSFFKVVSSPATSTKRKVSLFVIFLNILLHFRFIYLIALQIFKYHGLHWLDNF